MNDKNTTQSSKHPFAFSVAKVPETETKDSMLELMRTMVAEFVAIGSLQCFAGVSRETATQPRRRREFPQPDQLLGHRLERGGSLLPVHPTKISFQ